MATIPSLSKTLDNLNSSTLVEQYSRAVTDNIFKMNPLWKKMMMNGKSYDGGVVITEPVLYDYFDGEFYSGAQVLNPADKEILTTAQFRPANVEVPIVITDTDDLENQGKSAIIDLLETKFEAAQLSMEKKMGSEIFGAAASQTVKPFDLWGLQDIVPLDPTANPTAGSYGGITRTTASGNLFWRSKTYDLTGTVTVGGLLMEHLQYLLGLIQNDSGLMPDIIVTHQNMYNRLWNIADGRQQLGNEWVKTNIGCPSIDFNGIPIVVDTNCTAKCLYMLNTKNLFLKYHKKANMVWTPFMRPSNQLLAVKYLKWTGQLVCRQPRAQGMLQVA